MSIDGGSDDSEHDIDSATGEVHRKQVPGFCVDSRPFPLRMGRAGGTETEPRVFRNLIGGLAFGAGADGIRVGAVTILPAIRPGAL